MTEDQRIPTSQADAVSDCEAMKAAFEKLKLQPTYRTHPSYVFEAAFNVGVAHARSTPAEEAYAVPDEEQPQVEAKLHEIGSAAPTQQEAMDDREWTLVGHPVTPDPAGGWTSVSVQSGHTGNVTVEGKLVVVPKDRALSAEQRIRELGLINARERGQVARLTDLHWRALDRARRAEVDLQLAITTGDPRDVDYLAALEEIRDWLAEERGPDV